MSKQSISVVFPAWNEEANIKTAVERALAYLRPRFSRFEIIVVNDGSRDATPDIVKKISSHHPQVKLINHRENRGYGAALTSGFTAAKSDLVFYTDSDNQFDINELDKLLPKISRYDIVAGFRLNRQDPLMRLFIAQVYNFLIRLVFGLKIKDVDCAFKLYRRQVFQNIRLTSQTGLIDAEVLVKARNCGFSITQVGVHHYPRKLGQTIYEIGGRNKIFAFVRPGVILSLLSEIRRLKWQLARQSVS